MSRSARRKSAGPYPQRAVGGEVALVSGARSLNGDTCVRSSTIAGDCAARSFPREGRVQFFPRDFERFRHHARFAHHRHEVGIAAPARQHVQMQMAGNAPPRFFPGSCPYSNRRADSRAQVPLASARQAEQFHQRFVGQVFEGRPRAGTAPPSRARCNMDSG